MLEGVWSPHGGVEIFAGLEGEHASVDVVEEVLGVGFGGKVDASVVFVVVADAFWARMEDSHKLPD